MQTQYTTMGALTRPQLVRLLEILEPYRAEPVSAAVLSLAARLARQEVAQ